MIKDAIGKSGTVVGTAPDAGGGPGDSRFVVKFKDSAQSLEVIGNYETLGFSSELEKAKQFIGLQLWTTGLNRFMSSVKDLEQYYSWQWQPVIATPASKVTIEGVEWGSVQFPIVFHIRTGDGRAALWPIQRARPFDLTCRFDSSIRERDVVSDRWGVLDAGSTQDVHPMERGVLETHHERRIAIGMSDDMLKVTCGPSLNRVGAILSGNESEDLFECNGGRKFVMKGGKVVRFGQ